MYVYVYILYTYTHIYQSEKMKRIGETWRRMTAEQRAMFQPSSDDLRRESAWRLHRFAQKQEKQDSGNRHGRAARAASGSSAAAAAAAAELVVGRATAQRR